MIARLKGILIHKQAPQLLLDVNGVGYEIFASMNTFYDLPEVAQEVILHTHLLVREDAQQLYGFSKQTERDLFRQLIKINGIGAKVALSILSSIAPQEFICCIQQRDSARLVKIPGIGKKTAERLLIEMQDKCKDSLSVPMTDRQITHAGVAYAIDDAINALIALGYKPAEAHKAVMKVKQDNMNSEQLIRLALQKVAA
jgi:holliday junction DNA helicase RuvA